MTQSRQPKGIPVGGQFASSAHDEAASSLAPSDDAKVMVYQDEIGFGLTTQQIMKARGITAEEVPAFAKNAGWESEEQDKIVLEPDESREMDEITSSYHGNGDYDIAEVGVSDYADDPDNATVYVRARGNLLWNDEFTKEELNHYNPVVEKAYKDWFGADISGEEWDSFDVEMTREVPKSDLCANTVGDAAWEITAKWHNETDPGTFGSPYFGRELRRRIDNARVLDKPYEKEIATPADYSAERFTDAEARGIATRLGEIASENSDGKYRIAAIDDFLGSGVMDVEATDKALSELGRDAWQSEQSGRISGRRAKEIRENIDALRTWIDARPEFEKEDE